MVKKLTRKEAGITVQRPVKVLQFGEGNFLRGFVDWMIDVMNEKTNFNGAVRLVQPLKNGMVHLINEQDGLYHVLLQGIQNGQVSEETRLITSVLGGFNPYTEWGQFLEEANNPDLQFIISNTTEAGIAFDETDTTHHAIPESFPGKLTLLLYKRFQQFGAQSNKGLFIVPCELIENNGQELKKIVLQYIQHWQLPAAFAEWVNTENEFCNTLVDRIVPGYPRESSRQLKEKLGYDDNLMVMAEPFHLWVIEGSERLQAAFPSKQAGLDVKFVSDLSPYRTRKVRILNGAHTVLVPVAYLYGLRTVRESIDHPHIGQFIRKAIEQEIIPTLDLPKEELQSFADAVIERFQNPYIKHELITIALNSVAKYKTRILPSVLAYQVMHQSVPKKLVYSLAALIHFYKGHWNTEDIALNDSDEVLHFFSQLWRSNDWKQLAEKTLANEDFWGQNLNLIPNFTTTLEQYLIQIASQEKSKLSLAIG